jgi:hypothetical protein
MTQTIQNVSDTAFMVAGFSALENERSKPLFRDSLAAKLVGEHGKKILAAVPRHFVGAWSVVIRTVIITTTSGKRSPQASTPSSISALGSIRGPTASTCRTRSAGSRSISRT